MRAYSKYILLALIILNYSIVFAESTFQKVRLEKLQTQIESLNKMISNMEARVTPDSTRCNVVEQVLSGRLSLSSSLPVTTADLTSSTVYFHPYEGNTVTLYDGSCWKLYRMSTAISLALSGLTSGKNYDVFLYDSGSGTLALELSSAWTNDTTRANALALQDGVYVKSGTTTRRYLGTFRTITTTQSTDTVAKRYLWNYYNRRPRYLKVTDATSVWQSKNTRRWKSANLSTANRVEFVIGINEVLINAYAHALAEATKYFVSTQKVGIGLDSTSTNSANIYAGMKKNAFVAATETNTTTTTTTNGPHVHTNTNFIPNATTPTATTTTTTTTNNPNNHTNHPVTSSRTDTNYFPTVAEYMGYPSAVGYHYLQWLEYSENTGGTAPATNTSGTVKGGKFLGTNANATASGLTARIDG